MIGNSNVSVKFRIMYEYTEESQFGNVCWNKRWERLWKIYLSDVEVQIEAK